MHIIICCIMATQQAVLHCMYCIVHVPFVLLPMAPESFSCLKDVVEGNENGESLANVLEHSLQ